jgi:acetate kinase
VMGTRSGNLDAGILFHLGRAGFSLAELDTMLNRSSGVLGLAGDGDMRDVEGAAMAGDAASKLALDVYYHRLRHYLGAYLVELGGVDAIVFTAGVGENSPITRAGATSGLEWLGIELDDARNKAVSRNERVISTHASPVKILVIPTNEELEIARQSIAVVS